MDRRRFLARSAAAPAAAAALAMGAQTATPASAPPSSQAVAQRTFVLVHGTWLGGWIWSRVADLLRAQGHRVYCPTATGCGEREHLTRPDVGLETHIEDIMNVLQFEELQDVTLVGHSFAGITITGVADRMRDRVRQLVYLDALVPAPGRMSGVTRNADGSLPEYWLKRRAKFIDGYRMSFFEEYPMAMLAPDDMPDVQAWLRRRITTHPMKQWEDELVLQGRGYEGLPKTFIHCTGQKFSQTSERMIGPALNNPDWNFIRFPYPRTPMATHPRETADLLASL
jgi:pimeloyl-ACP methyl ester carboxylesterase